MRTVSSAESIARDIRHALRTIRTQPGFSIAVLLSLALGVGANIAIFSVVNAVLIRPLPYPNSDRMVGVYNRSRWSGQVFEDTPLTLGMFTAYQQNTQSFEEFGVWMSINATVTGVGEAEQIPAVSMTHGVFRALAVHPRIGRWFTAADELPGAQKTVILSYAYWRRKFSGDPRVIGRTVLIDSVPSQIIGVMPSNFVFLDLLPSLFTPEPLVYAAPQSEDFSHNGLALLKPGVTLEQANQDMAHALRIWGATGGVSQLLQDLQVKPNLRPLKQDVVGNIGALLKILMGALTLVLLLVCANVANLVQVRAQARRQEFAIRAALGAGRARIAGELLLESLTLGIFGGAIGLALAYAGLRLLVAHGPATLPRLNEVSLDSNSLLFGLAASVVSSILFGSIAGFKSSLSSKLENTRSASASSQQSRAQNALVVTQVALALILLIADGLLLRSFVALRSVKPGFTHPERIQTVRLFIPQAQVPEPARVAQMESDMLHELAAIPSVTAAAFATALPLELEYHNGNVISVEAKTPPGRIPPNRTTKYISRQFFTALGTHLLAGRDFTDEDLRAHQLIAIVSENMARENWGSPRGALGKRLRINGAAQWSTVVGVAENIHDDGVDQPSPTIVYFPAATRRSVTFALRSPRAGSSAFVKEIAAKIHAVDSNLALADVRTLDVLYRRSMERTSFTLVLLAIAAAMSLTLSIVGVYGVLAYAVTQRRREIGIRAALGAEPSALQNLFLRHGLLLASAGGAIGFVAAMLLSRPLSAVLFGVPPVDPATYALAGAVILTSAAIASYVPARRAASLNPMETLRAD